ncbi:hypothetical protein AB0D37_43880, partial [Streptomyces sp. NPDC048384]|uniref:hypothetical protein n=1 Tax=Streptomyces sp. NPDC048384 TaxID=3155487 RepID=UPI003442B59F
GTAGDAATRHKPASATTANETTHRDNTGCSTRQQQAKFAVFEIYSELKATHAAASEELRNPCPCRYCFGNCPRYWRGYRFDCHLEQQAYQSLSLFNLPTNRVTRLPSLPRSGEIRSSAEDQLEKAH